MIKSQFLRFLKDNGCYKRYMKEFYSSNGISMRKKYFIPIDFNEYVGKMRFACLISFAFAWNQTNNGFGFWLNLSNTWQIKTHEYEQ